MQQNERKNTQYEQKIVIETLHVVIFENVCVTLYNHFRVMCLTFELDGQLQQMQILPKAVKTFDKELKVSVYYKQNLTR